MNDCDCIFCEILKGNLPYKFYENEHFIATLDLNPLVPGHSLLIPREHYRTAIEFPAEVSKVYMLSLQSVMSVLKTCLEKVEGFTVCQSIGAAAYQTIPHGHTHIIPRWKGDPIGPLPIDRAYPVKMRKKLDEAWAAEFIRRVKSDS